MPIIRTLKESGHSYEAAKQRLLQATAHLQDAENLEELLPREPKPKPRKNRIISDSSSSSSSSSNEEADDDGDGDDDNDGDDDDDDEAYLIAQRRREKKLLKNLEKEMKRRRNVVSISRPSSYKRTEIHSITPAKPKTKKPKSAMAMISALNESSEEPDSDEESEVELTREAQEEEAFSLYKRGLEYQQTGEVAKAQDTYKDLLQTRFLSKVKAPEDNRNGVTNTAISLKYSTYKNLGNLALGRQDLENAMENYLEAVILDGTDVTLWYKIGTVSVKLHQLALARVAFEQGLRCSKHHWPCLDFICTVLYAINDYVTCLYYVAQALEKDKHYTKGFAFREQIFSEQPSLRRDCIEFFKHCDDDVFYYEIPKEKMNKVIDEALTLRYERQKLAQAPPLPRIRFLQRLTELRWKPLGERLVALYDHMTNKDRPMSLITILDLEEYKTKDIGKAEQKEQDKAELSSEDMDVDVIEIETKVTAKTADTEQKGGQMGTDNPEQTGEQKPEDNENKPTETDNQPSVTMQDASIIQTQTQDAAQQEEGTGEQPKGPVPTQSSAQTLKQLAEAFLRNRGIGESVGEPPSVTEAVSTTIVETEKQQDTVLPPDSTTAGLDSSTATTDTAPFEIQMDTVAGSSQESVQQAGKESSAVDSSQMGSDDMEGGKNLGRSKQNEDSVAMETDESQSEKRKGPKRKRMLRDDPVPGKRRSARVRNTTVKKKEEEESVNYTEVLRQFLPSTLLVSDDEDEGEVKLTREQAVKKQDPKKLTDSPSHSGDAFIAMETEDVHTFLTDCQLNNGVVDVMTRFLERLVAKHDLRWPDGLPAVFLEVYKRVRKHTSLPELFCCDEDEVVVREMSLMCLMSAEFNLELCLSAKTSGATPAASPATVTSNTVTCTHDWGKHHGEDMEYLQELTLMQYMLPDMWPAVPARVNWFKARYFLQIGKMAEGEDAFQRSKDVLRVEEEKRKGEKEGTREDEENMETDQGGEDPVEVKIVNIKHGGILSIATIDSEVESLQRCQSLEQLQRLHASGSHSKVVELLRPTLRASPRGVRAENTAERCSQLLLLAQSQIELKDAKESIIICTLSIGEAWQGVRREGLTASYQLWLDTLNQLLTHLDKAFTSCEVGGLGVGGAAVLRRGVNVLIKVIEWSMEHADTTDHTNATSILPWMVLYHIIKYEEDNLASKRLPDGEGVERSRTPSPIPMLPSSLMLLENAHDYLGRRTWCCNHEGALLKLYIRVLSRELGKYSDEDEEHPFSGDLKHTLEQCFFCLYGHPTKKAKTRHLQDHGIMEVPLDWTNCSHIFDYFKPKVFPEFDSYKTSSMSSELEGLLLKISRVIPSDAKPANSLETVQAYIDGSSDKIPAIPEGFEINSTVIQELYYLLADYYFKNKEFGKAIKFYQYDLCVSPDRLDSWAGMALARIGRLDLKLNNSSDSKSDGPIFKHGVAALRCFKRALEIDSTNYSLWIEYGSYAYILHSHASRQIKQKVQLKVSEDDVASLKIKLKEMLDLAEDCFKQASLCEGEGDGDEEWLVHYMLGKVAEKRSRVEESLRYYFQASQSLHENEARYPKKIPYHNPPDFSLEALEMYFRIHAAILKLVQCSFPGSKVKVDTYGALESLVQEASQLPFVRAEEKKRDPGSEPSTDTEQESKTRPSKPETPPSMVAKVAGSPVYVATPQDHDYLHEKYRRSRSRVSSQEEVGTDTASESDMFSGDESIPGFLPTQRKTITLRPVPARRAISAAETLLSLSHGVISDSNTPSQMGAEPKAVAETKDQAADSKNEEKQNIPAIIISKASPDNATADEPDDDPVTSDPWVKGQTGDQSGEVTSQDTGEMNVEENLDDRDSVSSSVDRSVDEGQVVAMETDSDDAVGSTYDVGPGSSERRSDKDVEANGSETRDTLEYGKSDSQSEGEDGGGGGGGEGMEVGSTEGEMEERRTSEMESKDDGGENKDGEKEEEDTEMVDVDDGEKIQGRVEEAEMETDDKKEEESKNEPETGRHGDGASSEGMNETSEKVKEQSREDESQKEEEQVGLESSENVPSTSGEPQQILESDKLDEPECHRSVGDDGKNIKAIPAQPSVQGSSKNQDGDTDVQIVDDACKEEDKTLMKDNLGEVDGEKKQGVIEERKEDSMAEGGVSPDSNVISDSAESKAEINTSEDKSDEGKGKEEMQQLSVEGESKEGTSAVRERRDGDGRGVDGVKDGDDKEGKVTKEEREEENKPLGTKSCDTDQVTMQEQDPGDERVKNEQGTESVAEAGKEEQSDAQKVEMKEEVEMEEVENEGGKDEGKSGEPKTEHAPKVEEGEGKKDEEKKMEGGEKDDKGCQGGRSEKGADDSKTAETKTEDDTKLEDDGKLDEGKKDEGKKDGEGTSGGRSEKGGDGETEGMTEEMDEETKKRHVKLIDSCLGAMKLCLQRFPQHYKSAYRMAYLYAYTPTHKNLHWSRDMLIGGGPAGTPKTPTDHMVAPGLFAEQHKSKNLFQGIWRIPIQDIDRSGSFPWHMYRSVALLVYILKELLDHPLLFQVAMKLHRTPEPGKKYLRDADRLYLAREAFDSYISTVKAQVAMPTASEDDRLSLILSAFRCFQIVQVKLPSNVHRASQLLVYCFTALQGKSIESTPSVIEQAQRFCASYIASHRLPSTPTHSDGGSSKGFHRDYPTSSSSRSGFPMDGRRPSGRSFSSGSDQGGMSDPGENVLEGTRRDASSDGKSDKEKEPEAQPSTSEEPRADPAKSDISSSSKSVPQQVQDKADGSTASARSLFLGKALQERVYVRKLTESEIQEQREALGRADPGSVSVGAKRKYSQMENTSENIASIIRTAAKEYEKSEARHKEEMAKSSAVVQSSKRFAGGVDEPSSSNDYPKDADRRPAELISTSTRVGGPTQPRRPSEVGSSRPAASGISVKVTPGLGQSKGAPVRKPGVVQGPVQGQAQGAVSKKVVSLSLKPYSEKVPSVSSTWKAGPHTEYTKMFQKFVSKDDSNPQPRTASGCFKKARVNLPLPASMHQRSTQGHSSQGSFIKGQSKQGKLSLHPPVIKVAASIQPRAVASQQKTKSPAGAGSSTQIIQRSEGQRAMPSASSFVAQFARHAGISQEALVTSSTSARPQGGQIRSRVTGSQEVRRVSGVTGGQVVRQGSGVTGSQVVRSGSGVTGGQGVRQGSVVTGSQVVRQGSRVTGSQIVRQGSGTQVVRPGSRVTQSQVVRPGSRVTQSQVVRPGSGVTQSQVVRPGSRVTQSQVVRPGSRVTQSQVVRPGSGVTGQRTPLGSRVLVSLNRPRQQTLVSSAAGRNSPSVGISSTATERQVAATTAARTSAANNPSTSQASQRRDTGDDDVVYIIDSSD